MPKLPDGLTVTLDEVSQEIDLNSIAGVDLSKRPRLAQEIGQALLDSIVDRTEAGKDIWGKPLKGYKKSYVESEDFEEFDKSANDVNMTLRGTMLDSIDFTQDRGTIKIAVKGGTQTKKAYNHNVGDTLPQRRFFGVTNSQIKNVLSEFSADIESLKESQTPEDQLFDDFLNAAAVSTTQRQQPVDIFFDVFGDQLGS
jgi:hypothetical protein